MSLRAEWSIAGCSDRGGDPRDHCQVFVRSARVRARPRADDDVLLLGRGRGGWFLATGLVVEHRHGPSGVPRAAAKAKMIIASVLSRARASERGCVDASERCRLDEVGEVGFSVLSRVLRVAPARARGHVAGGQHARQFEPSRAVNGPAAAPATSTSSVRASDHRIRENLILRF